MGAGTPSVRKGAHVSQPLVCCLQRSGLCTVVPVGLPDRAHPQLLEGGRLGANRQESSVGLHCKDGGQVLDASPSKLESFLFSWSGIELFPPVSTGCPLYVVRMLRMIRKTNYC